MHTHDVHAGRPATMQVGGFISRNLAIAVALHSLDCWQSLYRHAMMASADSSSFQTWRPGLWNCCFKLCVCCLAFVICQALSRTLTDLHLLHRVSLVRSYTVGSVLPQANHNALQNCLYPGCGITLPPGTCGCTR